MIEYFSSDAEKISVDKKMALRFLGCKNDFENEEFQGVYDECLNAYFSCACLKAVARKSKVRFEDDDNIRFDFGVIKSKSLKKNLQGCENAYIFAATTGSGIDRKIKQFSVKSELKCATFSCIASSGVECWCDYVNEKLSKGKTLSPRYSPGYGDVCLDCQREILEFLDAYRKIGLTLTDSLMMLPIKSVTAIIGIKQEGEE